jgi:Domain of unknown function (DUF5753)
MAASTQCGQQAATGEAPTRAPGSGLETAGGFPPPPPATRGGRGDWWEQSFPGSAEQLTRMRAVLGRLLADCPVADEVILLMSELGANAVRHSGSGQGGGIFTARLLDLPGEYVLGVVEDGGSQWDGNLHGSARDASGLYLVLALSADCGTENVAARITIYAPLQVPELLHTDGYARALAGDGSGGQAPELTVAATMARQQAVLHQRVATVTVVLGEAALRQEVGGADVQLGQLRHLAEIAGASPGVAVQVLPFTAGAHGQSGGFSVLQFGPALPPGLVPGGRPA